MTQLFGRHARGVYPIAPTPFTADGRVDDESLDRLASHYRDIGVDGVTVLGQLGEAPKLEPEEALGVVRRMVAALDVPVVVGVTAPGLAAMRSLTAAVMDLGAAGVMVAPAPHLRTDDQIRAHFDEVVDALGPDVPFVLQDYPLTFSVVMSPGVIADIASAHESCVMLKHEDWPGLAKISALRALEAAGRMPHLSVLCGNGGLFLDFEIERGADGAMTGYCFPEMLRDVVDLHAAGRRDDAHTAFDRHLPLLRYEQQPGIGLAVRKYVLMRRGLIASDTQRRPRSVLSETARAEVDYLLGRLAANDGE